ncbi:hypothetical protein [Virgisporangium ochraceum]|uniref:Uncharacterized protein n=1 Tax=Virgisporangium ochraceum TaxID=65505 RepID=A0A8J4A4Q7_9ACTN|nr:hypothetical protein [Virgisporangium ochraceum]GIJ73830.1 hypothetical protein Voc01_087470 [Virgisporangium ochraceum]
MRGLAIVERAYRGAVENQYADALYCAYLLHQHMGGLDILLRGPAVSYVAAAPAPPGLRVGDRVVRTLSDPRAGLRRLIAAGVGVWAEEQDVLALGLSTEDCVAVGVSMTDSAEMTRRWDGYWSVFYL